MMNSLNLKRPKRLNEEGEDDLIAFQENFLKTQANSAPAAKCVKVYPEVDDKNAEAAADDKENERIETDFDMDDKALSMVLSNVVEKTFNREVLANPQLPKPTAHKIEKIDFKQLKSEQTSDTLKSAKKKSLFAQNLERQGKLKSFYNLENVHQTSNLVNSEPIRNIEKNTVKSREEPLDKKGLSALYENRKQIITGDGIGNQKDVEQIHLENLERLSQMKPDEILKEQKKMIAQMDPKLVAFIRQKKFKEKNLLELHSDSKEANMSAEAKEEFLSQLPIQPDKKWLHMDKIEYDKLEWMTKPKQSEKSSSAETEAGSVSTARFNFAGDLIQNGDDIPVTEALHHHGNDPDSAGYALDELFHLGRSKFNQQRVIALQTIGNIIQKCHQGHYYDIIKSGSNTEDDGEETAGIDKHNLLHQLVDGGVLFLLRWSLDDQTESIINAALNGIKNLVQPVDQEAILDATCDLYKGHEVLSLQPFSNNYSDLKDEDSKQRFKVDKNLNVDEKKELEELTDEEYIKYDLIKGLFRMNIIARFFYLLNVYQPSHTSNTLIKNIFQIIYRCVRHSPQIAYELTEKYPDFTDLITRKFLPKFTDLSDQDAITNATMALKLVRLMASAGVASATKLFEKYELETCLINYLSISNQGSLKLQIEAIRLIKTLSLLIPQKVVSLISFETMLCNIKSSTQTLSNKSNVKEYDLHVQYLQALISLFSSLVSTSKNDQTLMEMCSGVFSIIQSFVLNKLKVYFSAELGQDNLTTDLNLFSVCFNFIVDYLDKLTDYAKRLEVIDYLVQELITPLLENDAHRMKFDSFIMSRLLSSSTSSRDEETNRIFQRIKGNNLAYLPTILNLYDSNEEAKSMNMKTLNCISSFCFMTGFTRLYSLCVKFRIKLFEMKNFLTTQRFLDNDYLRSYLKAFCAGTSQKAESLNNCYLIMRYENYFVYNCLKLAFNLFNFQDTDAKSTEQIEEIADVDTSSESSKLANQRKMYYRTSLALLLKLKSGDEYFLHDTLATCTFNMNIWSAYVNKTNPLTASVEENAAAQAQPENMLVKYFEQLKLTNQVDTTEVSYLNTSLGESEIIKMNKDMIKSLETLIYEGLNQIKFGYMGTLMENRRLEHSRRLSSIQSLDRNREEKLTSLFLSSEYSNQFLLKPEWIYAPISFYLALDRTDPQATATRIISAVSNALKFVYLLEIYQHDYMDQTVDITTRYLNLLYVYLFESEVFLDKQIVTYLYLILLKYSKDKRAPLEKLNLGMNIPGMTSFYDFYKHLLAHYDSTSFGDYLFSQFIIVPLQQRFSHKYRQLFWSEYFHLFKYIRFDRFSTQLLVPMKSFVEPNEKSLNMIRLYSQIMLDIADSELASKSRFAYSILVAHLNAYIFEHTSELDNKIEFEFKRLLVQKFMSLSNEKLKNDVFNYKSLSQIDQTQEFYTELPGLRRKWLDKLLTAPATII